MMGRVNSTFQILKQTSMMTAVLIVGLSSEWASTRWLFIIGVSIYLVAALLGVSLMMSVRETESKSAPP